MAPVMADVHHNRNSEVEPPQGLATGSIDWIIDLGPEGGGGEVVVAGTPEDIARHPDSHTGRFLASVLAR